MHGETETNMVSLHMSFVFIVFPQKHFVLKCEVIIKRFQDRKRQIKRWKYYFKSRVKIINSKSFLDVTISKLNNEISWNFTRELLTTRSECNINSLIRCFLKFEQSLICLQNTGKHDSDGEFLKLLSICIQASIYNPHIQLYNRYPHFGNDPSER